MPNKQTTKIQNSLVKISGFIPSLSSLKKRITSLFKKLPLSRRGIIVITTVLLLILGATNKNGVIAVLNRLKILHLLRTSGLIKPDIPGYFAALKTQNLIYDYNNDNVVTGDDYLALVKAVDPTAVSAVQSAPAAAEGDDPAAAENISLPSVRGFSTDAFTGAATSSFPFDLPPGPAGLSPSLGLSYSSGAVDDLFTGTETKWRNDADHSYQKQAGIFGLGWSLNGMGYIARDTKESLFDTSDDTFMLVFAGGAANLVNESDDGVYSVWRTAPNLKTKVERWSSCKIRTYGAFGIYSITICRYNWLVTSPDGTRFYFGSPTTVNNWKRGSDPDAEYFSEGSGNSWYPLYENGTTLPEGTRAWIIYGNGNDFAGWHALTYKWLLHKVESVFDEDGSREVEINFTNHFELGNYKSEKYTRAVYPYKINYGQNEVIFGRETRLDHKTHQDKDDTPTQHFKSLERINKIVIKTSDQVRNAYTFEYKYGWDPAKHNDPASKGGNGDGIPQCDDAFCEVVGGQAIHSLLTKITPWSDDPSP